MSCERRNKCSAEAGPQAKPRTGRLPVHRSRRTVEVLPLPRALGREGHMPPAAGRAHPVDLWLCGHHYRASSSALAAAGARAEDLTGMIAECPRADRPNLLPVRG